MLCLKFIPGLSNLAYKLTLYKLECDWSKTIRLLLISIASLRKHPRITDYTNWNALHHSSQLSIHVWPEAILDVTGEKRVSVAAAAAINVKRHRNELICQAGRPTNGTFSKHWQTGPKRILRSWIWPQVGLLLRTTVDRVGILFVHMCSIKRFSF